MHIESPSAPAGIAMSADILHVPHGITYVRRGVDVHVTASQFGHRAR